MAIYSVDSDAVLATTEAARGTAQRIQAECAALQGQVTSLQAVWTGQASGAFTASAEEWRTLQLRVVDALDALSAALATAGREYADAEAASAGLFH